MESETLLSHVFEAQEQERTRIGKNELRGNITQRLALLAAELDGVRESLPASGDGLRSQLVMLFEQASEILADLLFVSSELYPSRLEYLGIAAAMGDFSREFGNKHKVDVEFTVGGNLSDEPPEISLCLFRVLQEALHSAVRHRALSVSVEFRGTPVEIQLFVRHSGPDFDAEVAMNGGSPGLISVKERVNLVRGTFSLTSKPQSGTEISVRIPLKTETLRTQVE